MSDDRRKLLHIYLEDHLAGAVSGRELSDRTASAEEGGPRGLALREIATEIAEDEQVLRDVVAALGLDSKVNVKESLAWFGEKLGRLKLNNRLTERSPLSLVLELEFLQGAVMSKRAVWQTLGRLREREPELQHYDIDSMLHRADAQHHKIRDLHGQAVRAAFVPPSS